MITLIGSLLGFISAMFPDLLKLFRDSQDRKHELKILELQMQQQAQGHTNRLEEIQVNADIAESRALNGTVRPVIAYSFFALYALMKLLSYAALPEHGTSLEVIYQTLWTADDEAIFAGIISFYFGQRAMAKLRSGK
jgi:hypothetical protein